MIDKFILALNENIINPLIILMFSVALIVFVWGIVVSLANGGDEGVREKARRHMMYGILGMFIMISAFALVHLITGSLGIDTTKTLDTVER